jgi:hypothetical protein
VFLFAQAGPARVDSGETVYDITVNQIHEELRLLSDREAQRIARRSDILRRYREINPSAAASYEEESEASWLVLSAERDRADPEETRRARLGQESHNRWLALRSIPLQTETQAWITAQNVQLANPVLQTKNIGSSLIGEWDQRGTEGPDIYVSRGPVLVNPPFTLFTATVVTHPPPSRDRDTQILSDLVDQARRDAEFVRNRRLQASQARGR